ncbi:taspase, threonine aspartase, 1 [Entomortierella beljakovae]|nr:taspase, threonine aspartase, 1 [Entomortierella beljakovae]
MQGKGFVAVHVGAGLHSAKNKSRYQDACKRACEAGVRLLNSQTDQTTNAISVVELMIQILEDDPITNAGTGSNLNLDGHVECDASIMNGTTLGFGSVGAISDFKNPISVATKILEEADLGPLSLGRIPPIMLVGPGVTDWINTMGYTTLARTQRDISNAHKLDNQDKVKEETSTEALNETIVEGSLVTRDALKRHIRFQDMLRNPGSEISNQDESTIPTKQPVIPSPKRKASIDSSVSQERPPPSISKVKETVKEDSVMQDTVGAICIDGLGRVAAGVSSGGIAMKFPGRVSEAALFGAGCWAQDATKEDYGFACSMTGAGEQIAKTLLARTCMEILVHEEDTSVAAGLVMDRFVKSPLLRSYVDRHAGFIAVKVHPKESDDAKPPRAEFVFSHTTQTMGLAFMSTLDRKPMVTLSQRNSASDRVVYTRMVKL